MTRHLAFCIALVETLSIPAAPCASASCTFTNLIVTPGPDPWIVHHDGGYWFTATAGNRIAIRKARTPAGLRADCRV